ncbi:MAG: hypothetical protein ACP5EP_02820 [Acidobacteriaceae bacterium]
MNQEQRVLQQTAKMETEEAARVQRVQREEQEREMVAALLSVSVVADCTLVRHTQRRVRERALEMAARRKQVRQKIGLTILAISLLWLLLTPIVWGGFNQTTGWRNFTESEFQVIYLTGWLLPITLVTLVIGFLRARSQRASRRLDWLVR